MFKIFLDGEQVESVMLDDEGELKRYLQQKYWCEDLYPTYVWAGKSR